MWRARLLWDCGNIIAKGGVVDLVYEDAKESSGLLIWIRLELGIDLDDECVGDSGEQASL